MSSILEQETFERKISFIKQRFATCGYRFYDMIQTRRKQIPKLHDNYDNESVQQDVQNKVLSSADRYINCLHGEHHAAPVPEYLESAANDFKSILFTRLAPIYILEEERLKLVGKVFDERVKL